jgi:gamma-glutamyltranspeptidase
MPSLPAGAQGYPKGPRLAVRAELTIALSTADPEGNMVSWVNSNFAGFGSGITVPGYGFVLHNRGGLFRWSLSSTSLWARR